VHGLNGIRNVLFDLDGTLVDSSRTILDSVEHALQSMDIDPASGPPVERLIGRPLLDIFTDAFGMPRPQALEAIDRYRAHYAALAQAGTIVYEGVREGLAALAGGGYRLFLATVKPTPIAESVLGDLGLRDHFSGVAGASMGPERREKERIIAWALDTFGLEATESLMVGDRDQDIDGARANGLPSVAVSWGFGSDGELEKAAPDYQAGRFSELVALLTEHR
jgi:phosphoglycolate phosphatase